MLTVNDTGCGMEPAVLARASEPFFTTKRKGEGTGLGLAMARGFAEQSGGGLTIQSAPGAGTTVTLYLPRAEEFAGAAVARAGGARAVARAHVLLVDDDALVAETLAAQLQEAGFAVHSAGDATQALAVLEAGAQVDCLVTDLSMPGLDGLGLIAQAQKAAAALAGGSAHRLRGGQRRVGGERGGERVVFAAAQAGRGAAALRPHHPAGGGRAAGIERDAGRP